MSKEWKPQIEESPGAGRRRRREMRRAERWQSLRGGATPDSQEMVVVIGGGVILGLLIAFVPIWLRPDPGPEWKVTRSEERRIMAEHNYMRLGDRTPASAGSPGYSLVDPGSSRSKGTSFTGPDEYDRAVATQQKQSGSDNQPLGM
jgi:hypothetical protein